jgi:hypothetical protein
LFTAAAHKAAQATASCLQPQTIIAAGACLLLILFLSFGQQQKQHSYSQIDIMLPHVLPAHSSVTSNTPAMLYCLVSGCCVAPQVPHQYPPEVLEAFTSRGKVEWARPPLRDTEKH